MKHQLRETQEDSNREHVVKLLPRNLVPLSRWALLLFGALGAFSALIGDLTEGREFVFDWIINRAIYFNAVLHFLLVTLVLLPGRIKLFDLYKLVKESKASNIDNESKELLAEAYNYHVQFIRNWNKLWISWGVLYILLFAQAHYQSFLEESQLSSTSIFEYLMHGINFLLTLINNLGTFYMFRLNFILSPKLTIQKNAAKNYKNSSKKVGLIIAVITIVHFIILILFAIGGLDSRLIENIFRFFPIISGVGAALAFGGLAGKLDSNYIAGGQTWILLLFLYAALQVSFATYTTEFSPAATALVSYSAFTLKCIFYLFVVKTFESHRILFYYLSNSNVLGWNALFTKLKHEVLYRRNFTD